MPATLAVRHTACAAQWLNRTVREQSGSHGLDSLGTQEILRVPRPVPGRKTTAAVRRGHVASPFPRPPAFGVTVPLARSVAHA